MSLLKLRFSHFNPELLERLRGERTPPCPTRRAPDWAIRVMRLGAVLSILGYALSIIPLIEKGLDGLEAALFGHETALSLVVAFLIAVTLALPHCRVGSPSPWATFPSGMSAPCCPAHTASSAIFTRPFIAPLEWLGTRFLALIPTSSDAARVFRPTRYLKRKLS